MKQTAASKILEGFTTTETAIDMAVFEKGKSLSVTTRKARRSDFTENERAVRTAKTK
jgi:hypothetical protein